MADLKTTVTELVTGLGMCGHSDVASALAARPPEMVSVSPEMWSRLDEAFAGGALDTAFKTAFANGQAFLAARDGLRERKAMTIEWKGAHANPGDEALPVDLRIDHVYLVSCKYLSKVLHNASPWRVFDRSLRSGGVTRSKDWYSELAPVELQDLFERTVDASGLVDIPKALTEMTPEQRHSLRKASPPKRSPEANRSYAALCRAVSEASAQRWRNSLGDKTERERTFWRLLRFGPAPYFVLGAAPASPLRLRIATPWDWRQRYELKALEVAAKVGGQPMVSWSATVKDRHANTLVQVDGHVEVRWSHGPFMTPPEAKVYLQTPHQDVPGYFHLA